LVSFLRGEDTNALSPQVLIRLPFGPFKILALAHYIARLLCPSSRSTNMSRVIPAITYGIDIGASLDPHLSAIFLRPFRPRYISKLYSVWVIRLSNPSSTEHGTQLRLLSYSKSQWPRDTAGIKVSFLPKYMGWTSRNYTDFVVCALAGSSGWLVVQFNLSYGHATFEARVVPINPVTDYRPLGY
jgi:hypothetical protein